MNWHKIDKQNCNHSPFSLLVGFTLSDATTPNRGNFCVWPGSHRSLMRPIKKYAKKCAPLQVGEEAAEWAVEDMPDLGDGLQVLSKPGDVVFAHQKLAHRGGPNGCKD